ncbi:MAG: hypothetical protein ACYDGR_11000 [Candidatus Dormibacteria bacterium]
MIKRTLLAGGAGLVAVSALLVGSMSGLAYQASQNNSTGSVSSTSGGPGSQVTFTATFDDQNGNGVLGASVTFSQQSGPSGCTVTFSPSSGVTDSTGKVSTNATLPANCPGSYVLAASTAGATVTATVRETGGFPNTTTEAPASNGFQPGFALLAFGGMLVIVGGAATVVRRRS